MPIKLKYPAKPSIYDLTVGDLLAFFDGVPLDTPIEFTKFPVESEKYHVSKVYLKSVSPFLGDNVEKVTSITIVLF